MLLFNLLLFFLQSFLWKDGGAPDGQGEGAGAGEGGKPPTPAGGTNPDARTFTQDEVNRMVAERLDRERGKYSDYEDLKKKAGAFDAAEAAKQTDLERAQAAQAKAEKDASEKIAAAERRLITAEIKSLAAGVVNNPDHIVALLFSNPDIKVADDGITVEGVKKALDQLLKDHPYLKKVAGSSSSGGEFNGPDNKTLDEQIAAAESAGNWKLSNALKLQKMRATARV